MKTIAKIIVAASMMALASLTAFAQKPEKGQDFREQFLSEKIAFLTTEMALTTEEAQAFWPVYNQIQAAQKTSFEAAVKAYRALNAAVKEGKGEKEVAAALKAYAEAADACKLSEVENVAKYQAVLPVEKVAKLYLAEEKFRKMQVHRLRDHGGRPADEMHTHKGGYNRPEGARQEKTK